MVTFIQFGVVGNLILMPYLGGSDFIILTSVIFKLQWIKGHTVGFNFIYSSRGTMWKNHVLPQPNLPLPLCCHCCIVDFAYIHRNDVKWHRINVDATWWRCIDVDTTSVWQQMPTGPSRLRLHNLISVSFLLQTLIHRNGVQTYLAIVLVYR